MTVLVRPYGPRAVLVETHSPVTLAPLLRLVVGVEEVVPGACTVLVLHDGRPDVDRSVADVVRMLESGDAPGAESATAPTLPPVTIDVVYDGPDLEEVARMSGLGVDEVVDLHTSALHVSAFCGFAPGFAYLEGLPVALHVPRRSTPRTRVPAGSVAIAGPYSAVYPTGSPGGWRLLGRTSAVVWDAAADDPALLAPGTSVRFRSVTSLADGEAS